MNPAANRKRDIQSAIPRAIGLPVQTQPFCEYAKTESCAERQQSYQAQQRKVAGSLRKSLGKSVLGYFGGWGWRWRGLNSGRRFRSGGYRSGRRWRSILSDFRRGLRSRLGRRYRRRLFCDGNLFVRYLSNFGGSRLRIPEFLAKVISGIKPCAQSFGLACRCLPETDYRLSSATEPIVRYRDNCSESVVLALILDLDDVAIGLRINELKHISAGLKNYSWYFHGFRNGHDCFFVPFVCCRVRAESHYGNSRGEQGCCNAESIHLLPSF